MSEEKRLLEQIEALRKKMHDTYLSESGISPKVLEISRELDRLLNRYNRLTKQSAGFDIPCRNKSDHEQGKMLYIRGMKQLGNRIKELLGQKGITQKQLSQRTGISVSYLGKIIAGKGNPCFAKLVAIAHALGVEMYELFLEKERK